MTLIDHQTIKTIGLTIALIITITMITTRTTNTTFNNNIDDHPNVKRAVNLTREEAIQTLKDITLTINNQPNKFEIWNKTTNQTSKEYLSQNLPKELDVRLK